MRRNSVSTEFCVDGILCRQNSVSTEFRGHSTEHLNILLKSLFFYEAKLNNEQIIRIPTELYF